MLQGERETNELNNKLAQFSENAMKFTMDGGLSAYDYKNEEDEVGEDVNFKALAGENHHLQPFKFEVCMAACCCRCSHDTNQSVLLALLHHLCKHMWL